VAILLLHKADPKSKAVFTTKVSPTYDDLPEVRYHFPQSYLNRVRAAVGDSIVYYEPRRSTGHLSSRGGRQAYFAVAVVEDVKPDPQKADHFYAYVKDYLEFDRPVPFREGNHYYESALRRPDGQTSKGMFGRAVRTVPDSEFELILAAGFAPPPAHIEASRHGTSSIKHPGVSDKDQASFEGPVQQRPLVEVSLTRPFRDEAFRRHVCGAYGNRCAMSGLKLINGGGRPEVQAAHIRPVANDGPDSVRNGLALSGTLHWMFDRGLVAIDDDWRILRAKGVPEDVTRLIVPEGYLMIPRDDAMRPHPSFFRFHRENVFKG
jgi:putative restriction endonuclease